MRYAITAIAVVAAALSLGVAAHLPSLRPEVRSIAGRSIPAADRLLFDDEFDGDQLDLTKWYRCYTWCDETHGGSYGLPYDLEWMWKYNVSVSGGMLNLIAKKNDRSHKYTSGVITTGGSPAAPPTFTF